MYYVYVLESKKDGKHYIGQTQDLKKRFEQHNLGNVKSTSNRIPFVLNYYEAYKNRALAMRRERKLKQFKNSYKHLIERIT